MNTEPAPPWPSFLDGLKKSVAFSKISYLKFKLDLLKENGTLPRLLRSRKCEEKHNKSGHHLCFRPPLLKKYYMLPVNLELTLKS